VVPWATDELKTPEAVVIFAGVLMLGCAAVAEEVTSPMLEARNSDGV
jgi:hypothetical protein